MRKTLVKATVLATVYAKKLMQSMQKNQPSHKDRYWLTYITNVAKHSLAMQREMTFQDVEIIASVKEIVLYFPENDPIVYAHRFMIYAQQIQRDLGENLSYSDTDMKLFKKAFGLNDSNALYQKCVELEFEKLKVEIKHDGIYLDIDI